MSKAEFVTVKVSMICEKTVEVQVSVPIESLVKDEEGIYSFDEIQEKSKELAESIIKERDFDNMTLDMAQVIEAPDGFDYWT
jgi:DNA polymerase III delta prime subunit